MMSQRWVSAVKRQIHRDQETQVLAGPGFSFLAFHLRNKLLTQSRFLVLALPSPIAWNTCSKYRLLGSHPRLRKLDSPRVQPKAYILRMLPRPLIHNSSGPCL